MASVSYRAPLSKAVGKRMIVTVSKPLWTSCDPADVTAALSAIRAVSSPPSIPGCGPARLLGKSQSDRERPTFCIDPGP
ncbi:hypothetical protein H920_06916 [Fukomys damarensis]|uniref:Uncharacterized protein n=1 Tax=Fukomys damarensis TaxID=885580 RepID=A0A091DKY7_FUKDA|nr:hypothetical protein H920_06916 [Fukomys damarensis]